MTSHLSVNGGPNVILVGEGKRRRIFRIGGNTCDRRAIQIDQSAESGVCSMWRASSEKVRVWSPVCHENSGRISKSLLDRSRKPWLPAETWCRSGSLARRSIVGPVTQIAVRPRCHVRSDSACWISPMENRRRDRNGTTLMVPPGETAAEQRRAEVLPGFRSRRTPLSQMRQPARAGRHRRNRR